MRHASFAAVIALAVGGALLVAPASAAPLPVASDSVVQATPTRADQRPNFIIIQTDDMIADDLKVLPAVKALLQDKGATFTQTLTPFALCCPSRAVMMTGCYPHNTKVNGNFPPDGGFKAWEENNGERFVAFWLRRAGYHTTHIGKYINGYGMYNRPVKKVPSGWSEWHGSADPSTYQMYGYRLNEFVNGKSTTTMFGDFYTEEARNYGTDVYTTKALEFLLRQQRSPRPFYLQVAYLAPHVETYPLIDGVWKGSWADVDKPEPDSGINIESIPPRPALRHQNLLPNVELPKDPSFNEADRSDKQSFVRNLPPLSDETIADLEADNRSRKLSLLAVDEGIAAIVDVLRRTGQLDNTYIVFMGNNGYILGQHAITYGKYFPYEPALRLPMIIRGPGIDQQVVKGITSELDVAPTVLELAGVEPTRPIDGVSLVDRLIKGRPLASRTILLSSGPQKSANGTNLPLFDGVRTSRYSWWVYEDGFEEMYDLRKDPYQLQSVAKDPRYAAVRLALMEEWERLRDCQGAACQAPTPRLPEPTR